MIKMSEGLSNYYIDHVMFKCSNIYKGAFSSDNFPKHFKAPYSMIINLSQLNEKGSHFIAIIEKNNYMIYFDSFGFNCFVPNICKYINSKHVKKFYNFKAIQHPSSSFCGLFAMAFCLWMEKTDKNLDYFLQQFNSDTKQNDYICTQIIKKLIYI